MQNVLCRFKGSFNSLIFNSFQNLIADGLISPQTAKGNTPFLTIIKVSTTAIVTGYSSLASAIAYMEHTATMPTPYKACKKSLTTPRRFGTFFFTLTCVLLKCPLILFKNVPVNITWMMLFNQNHPLAP